MKALYFVFFVFLLLSTLLLGSYKLAANKQHTNEASENVALASEKEFPPIPVLKQNSGISPEITAESVFVVDINSGVSLYEKNPDVKLLPASTTKIITALVAMDHFRLGDTLRVGNINVVGQKMGLVPGEEITVEDLLAGLLIYSANDAAEVLAGSYPGGRELFIEEMNRKAIQLNLENSNYTNPSGLDGLGLVTTARDLARESIVAMDIPFFRQVVGTKERTVTSVDGVYKHKLVNINELVGTVPGVLGIKTGWTENAKENLVTYVERDGRKVIIVVLKSADRFGETKTLIDWVFENYEWKSVLM